MTYGWAILIVIIVAAVLFSLGVFNPATYTTTTATGFSGFGVETGGFQLSSAGVLTLQVSNQGGGRVSVYASGARVGASQTLINYTATSGEILLAPGQTTTLSFPGLGAQTTGASYSAAVNMSYHNLETGLLNFVSAGTLTGAVS